jgi:hypothetical protein
VAVYWRRRFLALLIGLAFLGMVGWACLGALGGGATGSNTADVGHVPHGPGAPATAAGTPGTAPSTSGSAAGTPGSAASTPVPSAIDAKSPGPGAPGPARPGHSTAPAGPAPCTGGDVVISVFATQASYSQGEPPAFDVDVVSTSAGTCTFNVGPRYLSLVVAATGKRVWGSADCAAGPGSVLTDLNRGVPAILPVSWDLQTSSPGCPATAARVAGGSYRATASDDGVTSSPVTFTVN